MGEDEKGIESPIEILRQLIEESGIWTKELVVFTHTLLVVFSILTLFYIYSYLKALFEYLSEDGPIAPVFIGIPIFLLLIYAGQYTYRRYKTQVNRRDKWVHKFRVLKKKEEEIERLLSEGAG